MKNLVVVQYIERTPNELLVWETVEKKSTEVSMHESRILREADEIDLLDYYSESNEILMTNEELEKLEAIC